MPLVIFFILKLMSTGIFYLQKRVNAYFKAWRVIFPFIKHFQHPCEAEVAQGGVLEQDALGDHALALLWRWLLIVLSSWQNSCSKTNWCGMAWLGAEKTAGWKEATTAVASRSVEGNDIWVENKEFDETQITNLCKCCSAAPCNGGSCGISPCAPRGSSAACNSAHNKHICEVFQLHKQTNKK